MYDPKELYEFSIINKEGQLRPFLHLRFDDIQEAYDKLEELGRDRRLEEGEEVVFTRLDDA